MVKKIAKDREIYDTELRKRFPCPDGCEEIDLGYRGIAYDRQSKRKVIISRSEYENEVHAVDDEIGFYCDATPAWFVKKIER